MTTVQIDLPDQLARDAQRAGLLSAERMEATLREQLRQAAVEGLRALQERLPNDEEMPPDLEQEIVEEIRAYRAEQRKRGAN